MDIRALQRFSSIDNKHLQREIQFHEISSFYSPFDDLFGLAALLAQGPSCSESFSTSPASDRSSCCHEHEHERSSSDSDGGSVFGSEKSACSPTGCLEHSLNLSPEIVFEAARKESPSSSQQLSPQPTPLQTLMSGAELVVSLNQGSIQISSQNKLENSTVVGSKAPMQEGTTTNMTYEEFLRKVDNLGPLITAANQKMSQPVGAPTITQASLAAAALAPGSMQPSATRFDAVSFLSRNRSSAVNTSSSVLGDHCKKHGNSAGTARYCVFCKNNGEEEYFYNSHVLKSDNGIVTCPVLRAYQCPICHASGDYAHTIKYCPLGKGNEQEWLNRMNNRVHSLPSSRAIPTKL